MRRIATLTGVAAALLCALSVAGFRPDSEATAAGSCQVADASNDGDELAFLAIINNYRAQYGRTQLTLNGALNRAAQWMAEDMANNNRFGHTDSLGRGPFVRTVDCGYPIAGGENLAAGTKRSSAASAFELFRNSPSHNENMLAPEYREMGIARVYRAGTKYGWYWATTFGSYGGGQPAPPPPPPPPPAAQQAAAPPPPPPTPTPTPEPEPPSVSLTTGTQLVTWPGPEVNAETALAGHEGEVVAIWSIDPQTGDWRFYMTGLPQFLNTLRTVRPGEAIWIVADTPTKLVALPQ